MSESDLLTPLQQYWGYNSFRPMQERIVRSLLAGHDTCVVMPTGGGKSLCYQLPAVMSEKTAIVISPLIALMQDQAAQLAQMGIPAAFVNSTMSSSKQSRVMQDARKGAYRLLYLSPERLQRGDTLGWLQNVPVSFFAIDEAHCISEWGHEFRPEYRQLSKLRGAFPDRPIAAFTASATRHVRHDILAQLQLRNPDKYIASFHRPNLRYLVRECQSYEQMDLLILALRHANAGNVIVYSPTIARVEETVDYLGNRGIMALPYHAKMEAEDRKRNQERWMSDEVKVLVGTIAFGLGINKASVRAVIHLALPKSIEQYYQEAGRAGRDGDPADCILLWRKQDAGLLGFFANKITDPAERDRAWQRYHIIRAFAESRACRHRQICMHFGEIPKWQSCNACDVCGSTPEWLPSSAQLTVQQAEIASQKWQKTLARQSGQTSGEVDDELREYLREWRRQTAKEQGVAAFVVMHDATLNDLCRKKPSSYAELFGISGIGERKAERYGASLLEAIKRYKAGKRATTVAPEKRTAPIMETLELLRQGKSPEDIAQIRGRQLKTVLNTVSELVEKGEIELQCGWIDPNKRAVVESACAQLGVEKIERLKSVKDMLPPEITYDEIRLVLAHLRRAQAQSPKIPA